VKKKFTLLELIASTAILLVSLSLFIPVAQKANSKAREAICQNNLKALGLSVSLFADDYNENVPLGHYNHSNMVTWIIFRNGPKIHGTMYPDYTSKENYFCPEETEDIHFQLATYPFDEIWNDSSRSAVIRSGYDSRPSKLDIRYNLDENWRWYVDTDSVTDLESPPKLSELEDKVIFMDNAWKQELILNRHGNFVNALRLDGSVGKYRSPDFVRQNYGGIISERSYSEIWFLSE
jgi:type II secretory pathway pseudopilin PulG